MISSRYKDGKYLNTNNTRELSMLKMIPIFWKFLTVKNDRKPKVQLPVQQIDFSKIINAEQDELKITWVGHSSQIINIGGKIVLTDPVYENKTAFMGPSRYNGDVPLNMKDLPQIDIVLITHNHYDHLNATTIKTIHPKVKKFFAPLHVGTELRKMGVPSEKITELDWWDEVKPFDDLQIAFTPTQHFSGRGLFDRNKSLWGSYVIKGGFHNVFLSGDSGYFEGFKAIGEKYGPFDYTLMECGAYNERWHSVHKAEQLVLLCSTH